MKDTVFHQLLKPLTTKLINECVKRFRTDHHYEKFKTIDHVKTMVYAQLHELKSLRTLEVAINSQKYIFHKKVSRSTLSDANKKRTASAFFWLLEQLMRLLPRKRCKEINEVVRILDSSPIQLRGQGYDEWAQQYAIRHIQGLKLHLEYDVALSSPIKVQVSHPNCNDATMGQNWRILSNTIYVFDKGYYDFNWWWRIHHKGAFFVTRLKKNVAMIKQDQNKIVNKGILEDGTFIFKNKCPRGGKINLYQEKLRYIRVEREGKKPLMLVSNHHDLPAEVMSQLYKTRWEIELFFKWIKQHLKIKKFLGKSMNAVMIQLATALISYLLVQFFKEVTKDKHDLYLVLVWIKHNLSVIKSSYRSHSPPKYDFPRRTVCL